MFDLMNPGTLLCTFKTWYLGACIYSVLEDNPVLHYHTLLEGKEGALITKLTTGRCSSWNKAQQRNQNRHKQTDKLVWVLLRWTWTQYKQAVWAFSVSPGGVRGEASVESKDVMFLCSFHGDGIDIYIPEYCLSASCQFVSDMKVCSKAGLVPLTLCSSFSANISSLTEDIMISLYIKSS